MHKRLPVGIVIHRSGPDIPDARLAFVAAGSGRRSSTGSASEHRRDDALELGLDELGQHLGGKRLL